MSNNPVRLQDKDAQGITSTVDGTKRRLDVKTASDADIATMQDDIALIKADIAAIRLILES